MTIKELERRYRNQPLSKFKELRLLPGWDKPTITFDEEMYMRIKYNRVDYEIPKLSSWEALVEELKHVNRVDEKNK